MGAACACLRRFTARFLVALLVLAKHEFERKVLYRKVVQELPPEAEWAVG